MQNLTPPVLSEYCNKAAELHTNVKQHKQVGVIAKIYVTVQIRVYTVTIEVWFVNYFFPQPNQDKYANTYIDHPNGTVLIVEYQQIMDVSSLTSV